ncbi:ABC-2 type transport system permease protein [Agromyces terreus]|uniref:ABC-2 type transport system permease protein n=1 Tax=Agromyces terreus TaxID=424795 RepID=A0A9X2H2Z7_9MICO|nr:ABC transporter permease [Agromyces terreus]MCP2369902.1 ABC-2 type transport system permease protein [Agromyces terreus]
MTAGLMTQGTARIGVETKMYFRAPDTLFFTFLFPFVMLAIFSAAFSTSGEVGPPGSEISIAALYLPAMVSSGIFLSGVQNLAVDIALEKSNGTLKRLGGTPLSPIAYFAGKIGQVFATGTLQAGLLILAGWLVLGIELPTEPEKWLTFAWVFVLGLTTCALLGIALSALPRSGKSAAAVVIPIGLILQFISGVYLQWNMLPDWLQNIASIFPLKWIAQGMRAVFLPEGWEALEQNESWNLPGVAVALLVWLVVGLVLSRLTFRWIRRDA